MPNASQGSYTEMESYLYIIGVLSGRAIRHRACAMRDTAQSILDDELNPEFEKACEETLKAIQERGTLINDPI